MFDGPIRDHARWTPRAPAVVRTSGLIISYAEFDADIDRFGAAAVWSPWRSDPPIYNSWG